MPTLDRPPKTRSLLAATAVVAMLAALAPPAAADHHDQFPFSVFSSCTTAINTPGDPDCVFVCAPGVLIEIFARGTTQSFTVTASCENRIVVSCVGTDASGTCHAFGPNLSGTGTTFRGVCSLATVGFGAASAECIAYLPDPTPGPGL